MGFSNFENNPERVAQPRANQVKLFQGFSIFIQTPTQGVATKRRLPWARICNTFGVNTAIAILILEVYYRFLQLYSNRAVDKGFYLVSGEKKTGEEAAEGLLSYTLPLMTIDASGRSW